MAIVIGITCDRADQADRYHLAVSYAQRVEQAGAVPVLLPHCIGCIDSYLDLCDGLVLSGGDDPDTTVFGQPVHPRARPMHPDRQQFDLALLDALDRCDHPVLAICLGMQLMALHHGGRLCQHLDDLSVGLAEHHRSTTHPVTWQPYDGSPWAPANPTGPAGRVFSSHHQAVTNPGRLAVAATADDGLIEAVAWPDSKRFYLGVQWHPERTDDPAVGLDLFRQLVGHCRR